MKGERDLHRCYTVVVVLRFQTSPVRMSPATLRSQSEDSEVDLWCRADSKHNMKAES